MKKFFLFTIAAAVSLGAVAQSKKSKNHKDKDNKHSSKKDKDYDDDDRNARWEKNDRNDDVYGNDDDRRDRRNDDDDYSHNSGNNLPRKVRDAFRRDYPNASNVNWSKDRGIWSATFRRRGLIGGNNTVSYRANGQRVNDNNQRNNPVSRRNNPPQQDRAGNPVYDKIFGKKQ